MKTCVGVLGATSLVGEYLLTGLVAAENSVVAFSRQSMSPSFTNVEWVQIPVEPLSVPSFKEIPSWVSLLPIWILPQYFPLLQRFGIKLLVALSSTSRFTKINSPYADERALAQRLVAAEKSILVWGEKHNINVILLQSTMIYAAGRDVNISSMARFIQKVGFFPVMGTAQGLRQPVYAKDVASACSAALIDTPLLNSYILSGGETLSYRDMVQRIFVTLNKPVRIISVPLWLFKIGTFIGRCQGKKIPYGIAERMNQDLVFDHKLATRDLNFMPQKFKVCSAELKS